MGERLKLSMDDDFLKLDTVDVKGISGGCYCCGSQIHIPFQYLDILPISKIENDYYYITLCDNCESDIIFLKNKGISKISYDLLWIIQEQLEHELQLLEDKKKGKKITEKERNKLLLKIYKKMDKDINNVKKNNNP